MTPTIDIRSVRKGLILSLVFLGSSCTENRVMRSPHPPASPSLENVSGIDARIEVPSDRLDAVYDYLGGEQDSWSDGTYVVDEQESLAIGFYPSGWMGDYADLHFDDGADDGPNDGTTYTKITYTPKSQSGWAGIYWTFPDHNWGECRGRSLEGGTRLTGFIRGDRDGEDVIELTIGGINRRPHHRPNLAYRDSFKRKELITLYKDWRPFALEIPEGAEPKSVIGGFAVAFSAPANESREVAVHLDRVRYDDRRPNEPRFLRSYTPPPGRLPNELRLFIGNAYVYDQVLVMLAYIARGKQMDLTRARMIADALVWVQEHDRAFTDGRWRNSYSYGPVSDPSTNSARLPGWFFLKERDRGWLLERQREDGKTEQSPCCKDGEVCDVPMCWVEDAYSVGSDAGVTAWAILGMLAAHRTFTPGNRDSPYLKAAIRAGNWIEGHLRPPKEDPIGGYYGQLTGWEDDLRDTECPLNAPPVRSAGQKHRWFRATEHAIDLAVAYEQIYRETQDEAWLQHRDHAARFVRSMWDEKDRHFWTGIVEVAPEKVRGSTVEDVVNKEVVPLDTQVWAVLALGHTDLVPDPPSTLNWVENTFRAEVPCSGLSKLYRFAHRPKPTSDKPQVSGNWLEGTAQLSAAFYQTGRHEKAHEILSAIENAVPATGGIIAACPGKAETGFDWTYPPLQHIGASAWYALSKLGANPYWINATPSWHRQDDLTMSAAQ